MFNLVLCYPKTSPGGGVQEPIASAYIPPIGMELSGSDRVWGSYKVVGLGGNVGGGLLDSTVYVKLGETD